MTATSADHEPAPLADRTEDDLAGPAGGGIVGPRPRPPGHPVGGVEHRADLGEVRGEVPEHPRILRPFAGEQEGHAGRGRLVAPVPEVRPASVTDRPAVRVPEASDHAVQPFRQLGGRLRHQPEPRGVRGDDGCVQGIGQVLRRDLGAVRELCPQGFGPGGQVESVGAAQAKRLGVPG